MRITKDAFAGTLESSDALVRVEPAEDLDITITSTVTAQFGELIEQAVREVLAQLEVTAGTISVEDKGALDCTLRARVKAAVARASDDELDWSRL